MRIARLTSCSASGRLLWSVARLFALASRARMVAGAVSAMRWHNPEHQGDQVGNKTRAMLMIVWYPGVVRAVQSVSAVSEVGDWSSFGHTSMRPHASTRR